MYAGLFFNLKQGFRERCRRWGKSCSPSLPPHGSAGAEGSETLGVDRNLLSVFCCLFWGGAELGQGRRRSCGRTEALGERWLWAPCFPPLGMLRGSGCLVEM